MDTRHGLLPFINVLKVINQDEKPEKPENLKSLTCLGGVEIVRRVGARVRLRMVAGVFNGTNGEVVRDGETQRNDDIRKVRDQEYEIGNEMVIADLRGDTRRSMMDSGEKKD